MLSHVISVSLGVGGQGSIAQFLVSRWDKHEPQIDQVICADPESLMEEPGPECYHGPVEEVNLDQATQALKPHLSGNVIDKTLHVSESC